MREPIDRLIPARVTIAEVAREAGVSTATVDRTLNNRDGVREKTRDRVLTVAKQLGYLPDAGSFASAHADQTVAIDFLLPGGTNTFLKELARHLEAIGAERAPGASVRVHLIEGFNPQALASKLGELKPYTDGIGVIALDHPIVREAIRDVAVGGTPVLTMVSDISNVPRLAYVGIDNRAAGRLAGHILGRFMGGGQQQVALFAGSLSYRGHEEREMGFRHILSEEYPNLEVVELREVRDDLDQAYRDARALISNYPDLGGIYNIGAGNRGLATALEEAGRAREVVFICHELTEHTRGFLVSGTVDAVIDQNPRVEARDAIDHLIRAARKLPPADLVPIRTQAVFKENIPAA
ncbi:LacI family DNA-binding transcriptional regulator [Bauldia sp.]|uniref:LacI family DNA-binding transcriptional regulator n=1 Tax=Bauldia sp. TaxID=2575872 RepID=UPI003BAAE7FD